MRDNVYIVLNRCTECPRMGMKFNHRRKLEIFSPAGTLEFLAIDTLEPPSITQAANLCIVLRTDIYTKLTRGMPITKVTSTQYVSLFFKNWIIPHADPDTVLSESGQHFVSKFCTCLCLHRGTTKWTASAFYRQTDGQLKRYKKTLFLRLQLYIADHEKN